MISYHTGNGNLTPVAVKSIGANDVSFQDTISLNADNVQSAIENLKSSLTQEFQTGVNAVYDACVTKHSTPVSHSLGDIINAILAITTETIHTGTFVVVQRSSSIDMGVTHNYRFVDTSDVPNLSQRHYIFSYDDDSYVDLGETNDIRYVDADQILDRGHDEGRAEGRRQVSSAVTFKLLETWGRANHETQFSERYVAPYPGKCYLSGGAKGAGSGGGVTREYVLNGTHFPISSGLYGPIDIRSGDEILLAITTSASTVGSDQCFLSAVITTWPHYS